MGYWSIHTHYVQKKISSKKMIKEQNAITMMRGTLPPTDPTVITDQA